MYGNYLLLHIVYSITVPSHRKYLATASYRLYFQYSIFPLNHFSKLEVIYNFSFASKAFYVLQ